ncbi:RNA-binding protein [Bacteroides sp. 224]|uniref:RNA-binding protein n=1 Tax=Bacteroides sp. 224 TaxID=2302936 RepID=UPI0013D291BD|nr:RNA-binding protein [Bacteroides sp. 224]NDV63906.1 RNA-binding protein [Bacteroides sp. 224]
MDLYIKDRFYIPQMFPQQGKFTEFNLKRGIIAKIAITKKDKKEYSIIEHPEDGKIEWDSKKDFECPLAVEFSKEEIDYLKKSCESLVETAFPDDFWLTVEKIYDAANS